MDIKAIEEGVVMVALIVTAGWVVTTFIKHYWGDDE